MTSERPSRADGRTARTDRTRETIVQAHLLLIQEGDLKPTGERIADRAGISLRTLWVSFKDLEALFEASGAVVLAREVAAQRSIDPDLPLPERISQFCAQRRSLLELVAPYARAAKLREPFSDALGINKSRHIDLVRAEIAGAFGPELAALPTGLRTATVQALLAAGTWSSWSFLRDDLGQSAAKSVQVMVMTVTGILAESAIQTTQQPTEPPTQQPTEQPTEPPTGEQLNEGAIDD